MAAPSTASTGISSINAAVISFSIIPPRTGAAHLISPTNSPLRFSSTLTGARPSRQEIEQRGARRIQSHALNHQMRSGNQQPGNEKERRRG